MKTPEKLKTGEIKRNLKILTVGGSGSGKTHFAATFPKTVFAITEPGGEDTFTTKPELLQNIVGWEHFIPENAEDTKRVFQELDQFCLEVRELVKQGKVETFVLDNLTYLGDNRFIFINTHQKNQIMNAKGEVDTRGAYGKLARWMYEFVLFKLCAMPCNVIVNCHEQLESDEALAKKPDKSNPVVPNILGGFRNEVEGMFSLVLYLNKVPDKDGYKYLARTNKGSGKNAKSRITLDPVIQNISYRSINEAINKNLKGGN